VSIRIATLSPQGLRAQATGGQTVLDVYQTIDRYLRRTLSSAHADLFAEPNVSGFGGDIDWYTPIDTAGDPQRLDAVAEPRRTQLFARLSTLIGDIRARAVELKSSAKQSDRLLGQLLLIAIEVPGEEFVYAVGEQPVLVFWGHLRDVPMPESGVVDRMIARMIVPATRPQEQAAASPPTAPTPVTSPPPTASPENKPRYAWVAPTLWSVFAVLCVAIALELLSACGLGAPFGSSLWINYCPVPSNPNAGELSELEAQNAQLQSQLDQLLGHVAGRREQCAIGSSPPSAVRPPDPAPAPPQEFQMPKTCKGAECLAFLKGCWGSPTNYVQRMGAPDAVSLPAHEKWCFDENGQGQFTLQTTGSPSIECKGELNADSERPGQLVVHQTQSPCSSGGTLRPYEFSCETDSQGVTTCSADNDPGEEKNILNLQREP
jgi:hypothetical protein